MTAMALASLHFLKLKSLYIFGQYKSRQKPQQFFMQKEAVEMLLRIKYELKTTFYMREKMAKYSH
jgi:hypothetical protein